MATVDPLAGFNLPDKPAYENPYQDMLETLLGQINNQQPFKYDPTQDQSYQAYLKQQQYLGDRAGKNALAQAAAATGGRVSSWAQSANTNQQMQYAQQAAQAMGQYEQQKYQRYQDDIQNQYQKANFIMGLDDREYSRYVDDFDYMVRQVEFEYTRTLDSLQNRREEIDTAWQRVKELGYVDNQASKILGVKVGTKSSIVQAEIRAQKAQIAAEEREAKRQKELIDYQTKKEKELISYRASKSGGGSGGSSRSSGGGKAPSNKELAQQGFDAFMVAYNKGTGERWLKTYGADLKALDNDTYLRALRTSVYDNTPR